jgi:UDPglucose--hexose-1-phosphate uridylyltransferase
MSELRFDMLHNKHVIIAPERQHRPNLPKNSLLKSSSENCPFCEGNEAFTPKEIYAMRENEADIRSWKTRVVPNLYRAVQIETELEQKGEGLFRGVGGFGAHEIIIDSPCHECNIEDLPQVAVVDWLQTMVERMNDLTNDRRLISCNIFKNSGLKAGATQAHPHTQIIALPLMPENNLTFLRRNDAYFNEHGRGIVADVVAAEKASQTRVVQTSETFLAYCPYASAFAFEVIIAPMKVLTSLNRCSTAELEELAQIFQTVFKQLKTQLDKYDYNIYFHLAPLNRNSENESYMDNLEQSFSFYIRITPRIYTLAGFEVATEMAINAMQPEFCASLLRGEVL